MTGAFRYCEWCRLRHREGSQTETLHRNRLRARDAEIGRQEAVRGAAPAVPPASWCRHRRAPGGLPAGYARGGWTHLHPCWRCGAGCTGYRNDDGAAEVRTLACCLCGDRHTLCAPDVAA